MSVLHYPTMRILSTVAIVSVAATMVAGCSFLSANSSEGSGEPAFKTNELTVGDAPESLPTYKRKFGESLIPIGGEDGTWSTAVSEMTLTDSSVPSSLVFHDVRVGEHADFYRVVLEFKKDPSAQKRSESDAPWKANLAWVDAPVTQGKGDEMETSGTVFLDVTLDGTVMPTTPELEELYYSGDSNVTIGPLEVLVDGTFEANTHAVIAMDAQHPVQTRFLTSPARLVIDVQK